MKPRESQRILSISLLSVACFVLLFAAAPGEARTPPPMGRTYVTLLLVPDPEETPVPLEVEVDCVVFEPNGTFCSVTLDACGTWAFTERRKRQSAFDFSLEFVEDDGSQVRLNGKARIDDRGPRNTLAAVARAFVDGRRFNMGFVGRPVTAEQCAEILAMQEE